MVFLLKLAISALLIAGVLRTEDFAAILQALRAADLALVSSALLVYAGTYYLRALRWQLLLRAHGVSPSIPFLIRSYLASVFFSNFLPSTIGGDLVRVYDSWKAGAGKAGAVTVILVDRFLGLVPLLLFAVGALLLSPAARDRAGGVAPVLVITTAAGLGALWFLFSRGSVPSGLLTN